MQQPRVWVSERPSLSSRPLPRGRGAVNPVATGAMPIPGSTSAGMAGVMMPPRRLRVIIYARVSKDHPGSRSVSDQIRIGKRRAEEAGWEVVGVFQDDGRSASQFARGTREDWPRVEEIIRAGGADILWLWELSRGTRDRRVWAELVEACQAVSMYIGLKRDLWDTTNPDHMAYLDNLMVRAIQESGQTRERILRDMESNAELGRPHGTAHYAYRREYDPETGELVRQVLHSERAALVLEMANRIRVGKESRASIARDLNRRGLPTPRGYVMGVSYETKAGRRFTARGWSATNIKELLASPTLYGKRSYNGRIIQEGGWEALMSEEEWRALQEAMEQPPQKRVRPRPGAVKECLSGVVICDVCEAPVYTQSRSTKSGKPRAYYRCRGLGLGSPMHGGRLVEALDAHVRALVCIRVAHPDVRSALMPQQSGTQQRAGEARVAEIQAELADLERALEAGEISWQMAGRAEKGLLAQLERAREQALPVMVDPLIEELVVGTDGTEESVGKVWDDWTVPQRQAALRLLAEEVRMRAVGSGRKNLSPEESVRIKWRGVGVALGG